jgi:quinoprotein glucose dehydrogenase
MVRNKYSREEVHNILVQGRGQMPNFTMLSGDEHKALVAFLWDEGKEQRVATEDLTLSFSNDVPYVSTGHREFRDHEGFPASKRPWATISAIDLDAGRIVWQVPLGTYPELEARGLPATGTFNMGGPVVTAGGLVFIGASMDERFHAYDSDTGELLWEFQLDAGGYATPATYEIDGRQYIVIAAGGGGKPGTRPGDAYYCFALPEGG